MLDAADVVRGLGGHARYGEIVAHTTRAALRRAVTAGALRRLRRGLYGQTCPHSTRSRRRPAG
jgi:hypothetical protein